MGKPGDRAKTQVVHLMVTEAAREKDQDLLEQVGAPSFSGSTGFASEGFGTQKVAC